MTRGGTGSPPKCQRQREGEREKKGLQRTRSRTWNGARGMHSVGTFIIPGRHSAFSNTPASCYISHRVCCQFVRHSLTTPMDGRRVRSVFQLLFLFLFQFLFPAPATAPRTD
ncbi:uncharacterized protein LOC117788700 [Drosophila innubila]|uniref:uncharacterized protein LOC117788700 n=1 Tax=Drosophila innubila TaxID=198719 RepID=UPI00148DAF55|nr:uncharacterized protein LOC117788700 [Drosophila innubila]